MGIFHLIQAVKNKLKEATSNVYYEQAPQGTKFPYLVFKCYKPSFDTEPREDFIIEVNIWDKNTDSALVEEWSDNIEDLFNYEHTVNEHLLVNYYRLSRLALEDEDKAIKRRELRFVAQTYFIN